MASSTRTRRAAGPTPAARRRAATSRRSPGRSSSAAGRREPQPQRRPSGAAPDAGHGGTARLSPVGRPAAGAVPLGGHRRRRWWWPGRTSAPPASALLFGAIVLIAYAAYRTWRPDPLHATTAAPRRRSLFEFGLATGRRPADRRVELAVRLLAPAGGHARRVQPRARCSPPPHRSCAPSIVERPAPPIDATSASDGVRDCAAWLAVTSFVAVTSGVARQVSRESARQQSLALDRLGRLAEANALLFSLHRVAQTLPASLDLDEVLDSTMQPPARPVRLRQRRRAALDDTDGAWVAAPARGHRDLPDARRRRRCPAPLQRAMDAPRHRVSEPDLADGGRPGLAPRARSGLYAALRARGALDRPASPSSPTRPTTSAPATSSCSTASSSRSASPSTTPAGSAGCARRRRRGAHPHRPRPPRPHRPVARLPRLRARPDRPTSPTRGEIVAGRSTTSATRSARSCREVRETLYDLRTDVSDAQDLAHDARRSSSTGSSERSGLEIDARARTRPAACRCCRSGRCGGSPRRRSPTSSATPRPRTLTVTWRCDGKHAGSTVADDGVGFAGGTRARSTRTASSGMRERAASIGATLDIRLDARWHGRLRSPRRARPPGRTRWRTPVTIRLMLVDDHRCCARACGAP